MSVRRVLVSGILVELGGIIRSERKNAILPQRPCPPSFPMSSSTSYQNSWNTVKPAKLTPYEYYLIHQILGINKSLFLHI